MRALFLLCLFVSINGSINGYGHAGNGNPPASQLDSLFSTKFSVETPGVAVMVAQKGAIIYEKAFGSASLELKTALYSKVPPKLSI
jgi:hypothetical protein